MFAKDALDEIEQWRKTQSPRHQLDWRWVETYRQLTSFDSFWWLAPAGHFNEEEQQRWNELFTPSLDEITKKQLGMLISQSRERELTAAIAERREPRLHYPAIAIDEVRNRISGLLHLDKEISQHESNSIVRRLYHDTIEEELYFLYLIEATHERNWQRFWECNLLLNPLPTSEEMHYALSRLSLMLRRGLAQQAAKEASLEFLQFLREQLQVSLDLSFDQEETLETLKNVEPPSSNGQHQLPVQAAKRFFEEIFHQSGFDGWQVIIDPNATNARVEHGLRRVYLADSPLSLDQIRHYLSHELASHAARCVAGEHSLLGLLSLHTKNARETEEGLAVYYDRQAAAISGQVYDDTAIWTATLATGLASGVITAPQTFLSLCSFFERLYLLYQLIHYADIDVQVAQETARKYALTICIRTYRGVPDLEKAGICSTKDALYLRGLRKIEQAVAQDETILERLAVGVVALELLPDLQELGIVSFPQPLRKLATDPDLDMYILSFEQTEANPAEASK